MVIAPHHKYAKLRFHATDRKPKPGDPELYKPTYARASKVAGNKTSRVRLGRALAAMGPVNPRTQTLPNGVGTFFGSRGRARGGC